jgi:hypothetical protein
VVAWDGDPASIRSPLQLTEGFRYELAAFNETEDGPDGLLVGGVFVAPDATTCTLANPAMVSPTLGTLIVSGDSAWWDDGFINLGAQDRADWVDDLTLCPGAPEFWATPFWTRSGLTLEATDAEEEINGTPTRRVDIVAAGGDMDLTAGAMWVTTNGYPLRVQIEGSVAGGVDRFIGADEIGSEAVQVRIRFEILEIDAAALAVRDPGGALLAGPLGDVTPTITALGSIPESVSSRAAAARGGLCFRLNNVASILGDYEIADLSLSSIFAEEHDPAFASLVNIYGGLPQNPLQQMTTSAEGSTAVSHVRLYFRSITPLVALGDWTGLIPTPWTNEAGTAILISVAAGTSRNAGDDPEPPLAVWDGSTIRWAEPTAYPGQETAAEHEVTYHGFLRLPQPELEMSDNAVEAAHAWMRPWINDVAEALRLVPDGDFEALANLRALAARHADVTAVACALLGTAWVHSDAAFNAPTPREEVVGRFADEVAAQNLLLFLEYVEVIVNHLERPGVDWLEGEDTNLRRGLLAGDTDATFLQFFANAALSLGGLTTPDGMREAIGLS